LMDGGLCNCLSARGFDGGRVCIDSRRGQPGKTSRGLVDIMLSYILYSIYSPYIVH